MFDGMQTSDTAFGYMLGQSHAEARHSSANAARAFANIQSDASLLHALEQAEFQNDQLHAALVNSNNHVVQLQAALEGSNNNALLWYNHCNEWKAHAAQLQAKIDQLEQERRRPS